MKNFLTNLISPFWDSLQRNPDNNTWMYIWFILAFAILFSLHLLFRFLQSRKKTLIIFNKIKNFPRNSINQMKLFELKSDFDADKSVKEVWHEFDESLVKVGEEDVYNTIDASFFFNAESLGAKFIDSRLIGSVPGLLTALGVLGTFYGLSRGLSGIVLTGDDIDSMKAGISILLSGAGTAFMTSLWGVGLSFLYNFFEKVFERDLQNNITKLQNKIDDLFPRKTAESQLQDIVESNKQAQETLQGLAEQIGNRMQEIMSNAGVAMGEIIATKLGEKLDDLVDKLDGGNEKALGALISDFTESLKESGANSGAQLENAALESRKNFEGFSHSMANFISNFDERMMAQEMRDIERNSVLQKVVADIATQSTTASDKLREATDELVRKLGETVSATFSQSEQIENNRRQQAQADAELHNRRNAETNHALQEVINGITTQGQIANEKIRTASDELVVKLSEKIAETFSKTEEMDRKRRENSQSDAERIDQLISGQTAKIAILLQQGEMLNESFGKMGEANNKAAERLSDVASTILQTSHEFKMAGSSISAGVSDMGNKIQHTGRVIEAVHTANNEAVEKLNTIQLAFEKQYDALSIVVEAVAELESGAQVTFENLTENQLEFIEAFKTTIENVQTKVKQFLSDYSNEVQNQTTSRMNDWNTHTSQYTTQMITVVDTINNLVGEIDDRMSGVRN